MCRSVIMLLVLAVTVSQFSMGSCMKPKDGEALRSCSYSAINDNCELSINRLDPVTPPTIYVHRGCYVRVNVTNPSTLEMLTLDWKSSTTVVPPDVFQTIFTALSPNLGKITIVSPVRLAAQLNCETSSAGCTANPNQISEAQSRVQKSYLFTV
jgi:hypothetical protein